jgi:hypothetical protein
MADKFAPVTEEAEIAELLADTADIGKPFPHKPNGHLWVLADELKQWRASRASSNDV